MSLAVVPISFADACRFIAEWHRHHAPPVGHKFSLGVADGTVLRGVAVVGRPVARHLDNGQTLEVTRTATDGTPHVNSMLYGACWRAARELGYRRLVTYTQAGESGVSLRAATTGARRCGSRGRAGTSRVGRGNCAVRRTCSGSCGRRHEAYGSFGGCRRSRPRTRGLLLRDRRVGVG